MIEKLKKYRPQILRGGFFVAIIIALLISLTSLWLKRVFFTPQTLSQITTSAIQEEATRDSISSLIVERIFEDRPAVGRVVGPRIQPVISGLLGTDIAGNALGKTVEYLRVALTTNNEPPIAIDLTTIKGVIVQVQNVIGRAEEDQQINVDDIPDEIVLLDTNNLPNIYTPALFLLWLGPISFLFAVGGLSYWIYRGRSVALFKRLRITGYILLATSAIALLVGPLTEPVIVSFAKKIQGQTILGNLYGDLLAPFNHSALVMGIVAVVVIVASIALPLIIGQVKTVPVAQTKSQSTKAKKQKS